MNNLSKTFYLAVQKGLDAAKFITEPKDKAMAYASIVNAIALTGLVESSDESLLESTDTTAEKETTAKTGKKTETKKTTAKDSLKADAAKGKATPKEETPAQTEEPVEESTESADTTNGEIEVSEEWTDEMSELKSEQLGRLNEYVTAWGDAYVYGDCVTAFFETAENNGADDIRPTNIDGFVSYLDQLAAEFAKQE